MTLRKNVWLNQNTSFGTLYYLFAKPCGCPVALALQGFVEKRVVDAFWA
jgi:hypothetical protein